MNQMLALREFQLLRATTQEIFVLDLEDEISITRLEELQVSQQDTRDQIEQLVTSSMPADKLHLTEIIAEIAELELGIRDKLIHYQNQLAENIREMKKAKIARNKYNNNYSQSEGFFLDRHQ